MHTSLGYMRNLIAGLAAVLLLSACGVDMTASLVADMIEPVNVSYPS